LIDEQMESLVSPNIPIGTDFKAFIIVCILIGGLFLPSVYAKHHTPLMALCGYIIAFINFIICTYVICIGCCALFSAEKGLYRIETVYSVPPKWAHLSISYRVILHKNQAIESISEFCAIQGGLPNYMLFSSFLLTLCLVSGVFGLEMAYSDNWSFAFDDIAILLGALGFVIIAAFENDKLGDARLGDDGRCTPMSRIHHVGVFLSTFTWIGFNYQQMKLVNDYPCLYAHLYFPIVLDLVCIAACIYWRISFQNGRKYTKEHINDYDPNIITRFSFVTLSSEGICVLILMISWSSWMIMHPRYYLISKCN